MNMKHASIIVAGLAAALAGAVGSASAATHAPGRSATVGTAASSLGRILVGCFVQDTKRGQTNGQGLKLSGAEWYVLSPAGTKIDRGNGAAASGY
jgi:hypothetical protein